MALRANINAPDWLDDHLYRALGFGHRRSRSCDSYIQAPDNISVKFGQPVRSSKATNEFRGRSESTVSAMKSSLSGTVFDEYQICRPESCESPQMPFTEQEDTNTFALCSTSPISHSLSEKGVEDTQRFSASPGSGQDIDGKDCHLSGDGLGLQRDCARKPKATLKEISSTGFISDEAQFETKDNRRSREATQRSGSPCKSDLSSGHEESDQTRIKKSTDELSTSALQKFVEIFDVCDAEKRFNSDPKKCLLNTKEGQRCGGQILWKNEDIVRQVLASLANLYFKDDEQECIHQLERLADLAICKRNHREKAKRLIVDCLLHDHGPSIVKSVIDETDRYQAGASRWGSSNAETTDKSSRIPFKKQDVISHDIRKQIQGYAKGRHHDGRMKPNFRTTRPTTSKERISYLPKFLPYKPREATKSSTTDWLKKQISKPLLPSELDSGWLYVYWNGVSFGKVKIGFTIVGVDQRLKGWISRCKHEVGLHACSDTKIPHVRRLEQIVHAEFKDFRYCEMKCPGCHRSHKEWFQPPSDSVRKQVIEKWTRWMLTEPYEEVQGVWQVKPHHAQNLDKLGNICRCK